MKLKLKLDKKTLQEFFLQNVEKFVLGIAVLFFLAMAYGALTGVERYQKTPEQLSTAVQEGQRTLEQTTPDPSLVAVTDYAGQAKRILEPLKVDPYITKIAWDDPLFRRRGPRSEPPFFTVQQLRGAAGKGAMQVMGGTAGMPGGGGGAAAGGSTVQGKRWVVLTALVPIERQELAYSEVFKSSIHYDAANDHPVYRGYWVQRAEVESPGDVANVDWERAKTILSVTALDQASKELGTQLGREEVVAKEYIQEALVFPLGPLVSGVWGDSAAHAPEIPAQKPDQGGMGTGMPGYGPTPPRRDGAATPPATAPPSSDDPFGRDPRGNTSMPGPGGEMQRGNESSVNEPKSAAFSLFRFIDYTVEPGKNYVYRVRLGLQNPNYRMKASYLKDPAIGQQSYVMTKWSEPSPVIFVPRDIRVLVLSVKPGRTSAETQGNVVVAKWEAQNGQESLSEIWVGRGQLTTVEESGNEGPAPAASTPSSASLAIDFRGGQPLSGGRSGTLTSAGEALLLGPDGNLFVRNELEDRPVYDKLQSEISEPTPTGPWRGERAPTDPRQPTAMPAPPGAPPGRGGLEGLFPDAGSDSRRRPVRPPRAP